MMVWKMIFLFQGCILRFHVNLPGCISCIPHFGESLGGSLCRASLELHGLHDEALHLVSGQAHDEANSLKATQEINEATTKTPPYQHIYIYVYIQSYHIPNQLEKPLDKNQLQI